MYLAKFLSTEIISSHMVEGTIYMFEPDEIHDVFSPSIVTPELYRIFIT